MDDQGAPPTEKTMTAIIPNMSLKSSLPCGPVHYGQMPPSGHIRLHIPNGLLRPGSHP